MKTLLIVMAFFVGCYAIEFKYPGTNPCIIVQMNANLSITMTNTASNATMKVDGVLDGIPSGTGACGDTPNMDVTLSQSSDLSGTLSFSFSKSSDSKVSMVITYTFVPNGIFNNNDGIPQTLISASVPLSNDNTSYTCTAAKEIMFNIGTSTGFKYEFKMHISQVWIQAFNIKDGKFSPANDCTAADMTSEAPVPTTQQVTTQQTTEPTTEPTAEPTTEPQQKNDTTEAPVTTKMLTSEAPQTSEVPTTVTTTEQPTTKATTVVPTTTMTPEPTPKPGSPDTNTYTADSGNTTCILLKAGIEFTVPYIATGGAAKTVVVGVPKGFTVKGNCNGTNTTQILSVSFYNNQWNLKMVFATSDTKFYMSEVDLNAVLDSSVIKDINNTVQVKINKMFGSDQFSADKKGSYKCSADTTLTLDDKGFLMNTYNLQYAAFQSFPNTTTDFTGDNISECSGDTSTNSVVPIAVGAALAGLVVIVLIAYLIGRRRSRAAGYEQV